MTDFKELKEAIEILWHKKDTLSPESSKEELLPIEETLRHLDNGELRVAYKKEGSWHINQWAKQAILLAFRTREGALFEGRDGKPAAFDTLPAKFARWTAEDFRNARIRVLPGGLVRYGAYISPGCVLTPSFVNIGAFVAEGTMVDTWATIGSCAQIGKNVHLSGGAGIGGVLEPLQANPVIIEDNCFIGARSEIVEGVIVEEGSVIAMGTFISASTKIIDRTTGEIFQGRVPAHSVVVPGSLPGKPLPDGSAGPNLTCAVIVKRVDEKTRSKTSINELLRS